MHLHNYLSTHTHCPICNHSFKNLFSNKSKKIISSDGYLEVEYRLLDKFANKTVYDYNFKYKFFTDTNLFFIEFYKDSKVLDSVSLKLINSFLKKKHKDLWVYKQCPQLCCNVNSNSLELDLKTKTVNPVQIKSFSISLDHHKCKKYNLPFVKCNMYSSVEQEYTYLNAIHLDGQSVTLEYQYYLEYQNINKFINKLPNYLLLS